MLPYPLRGCHTPAYLKDMSTQENATAGTAIVDFIEAGIARFGSVDAFHAALVAANAERVAR